MDEPLATGDDGRAQREDVGSAASRPTPVAPPDPLRPSLQGRDAHEIELFREATTMALYISLSLLAVLIALPIAQEDGRLRAGLTVLVTAAGLILAHHVAFRLSSRLVNGGILTKTSRDVLTAQLLGGAPVALVAALPVFVLGEDPGENVAIVVLLGFVALVGYRAARASTTPLRAAAYVAVLVAAVSVVVAIKLAVGH
jgi:hypothetical protein